MARTRQYDILKQPIPTLLVTFGALLLLLTTRALRAPYALESTEGVLSPVGAWVDALLGPYVGVAVSVVAIILASILLIRIINRYSLSVIRSFMPMVLFMICVFGVAYPVGSPSMVLAILMLTKTSELMFLSFKRHECFGEVMSASFWTAMASLLVPEMAYLLILLPAQWLIWQRSPREMIAGLLMIPLPLLLFSCLNWFNGAPFFGLLGQWSEAFPALRVVDFAQLYATSGGVLNCALWGLITLLTLLSIVVFMGGYNSMRTRARKGHIIFSLLFLLGLMMFLFGCRPVVAIPIMGFAAVPLVHTFFVRRKGVVSVVIYLLLVGLSVLSALQ
jgi:hypothetical protein